MSLQQTLILIQLITNTSVQHAADWCLRTRSSVTECGFGWTVVTQFSSSHWQPKKLMSSEFGDN